MLQSIVKFIPNLVRGALVGGVLVNDAGDGVITEITRVTDTNMLLAYVAVSLIQLLTIWLKNRHKVAAE